MAPLSPSRLRAINLIELLKEEAGTREEDEEEEVPEEAVDWPEDNIRAWFSEKKMKKRKRGVKANAANNDDDDDDDDDEDDDDTPLRRLHPLVLPTSPKLSALRSLWFPSTSRPAPPPAPSRTGPSDAAGKDALPSCVLVAFACAGSAEDLFSSEGSGPRRAPSPLLRWLERNEGRLLAVQLPGRAARRKEPFARSAAGVAREVASLVAAEVTRTVRAGGGGREERIERIPWFVAGHSMGAWLGFELASAARELGVHAPERLLLSAMPPPHTPPGARPWRGPAAALTEEQLVDECRAWGISEAVFSPGVWEDYEPLLRADFRLFDEYEFVRGADPPFSSKMTFFFGDRDSRVPEHVAREWERYTEGGGDGGSCSSGRERETGNVDDDSTDNDVDDNSTDNDVDGNSKNTIIRVVRRRANFELLRVVDGRHLWPLDKSHKQAWLFEIAKRMASDLGLPAPEERAAE